MKSKDNAPMFIVALLVLLLLLSLWGYGPMGGMMFFGPVVMVSVLVLIVWLIVSLTQRR